MKSQAQIVGHKLDGRQKNPLKTVFSQDQAKQMFLRESLDMTWRLAMVVLIPIIAGYELDKLLKTLPLFTMIGLVIAMVSCYLVVMKSLKRLTSNNIRDKK